MKRTKEEKGITLIALVVTIIILLILAGVTISMVLGQEGLFAKARQASIQTELRSLKEQAELIKLEMRTQELTGDPIEVNKATLTQAIVNRIEGAYSTEVGKITVGEYEIIVDDNLNIEVNYTGEDASLTDDGDPIIESFSGEVTTYDSITLNIKAKDNETGISKIEWCYKKTEETEYTKQTSSYIETKTITVEQNEEYKVKAIVYDVAGNSVESEEITLTTPLYDVNGLKAGDYVNYIDKNGNTIETVVLYDTDYNETNGTNYGVQIITADVIKENGEAIKINLGNEAGEETNDMTVFNTVKESYNNNFLTKLNGKVNEYLNTELATSARCIGTNPDPNYTNVNSSEKYVDTTNSWMDTYGWNNIFTIDRHRSSIDRNQLNALNIRSASSSYFMAYRYGEYVSSESYTGLAVGSVNDDGAWNGAKVFTLYPNGDFTVSTPTFALRAVFTLNSTVKITGGNGTDQPYTLSK